MLHGWHQAAAVDAPVPSRLGAQVYVYQPEGHALLQQRDPGALSEGAEGVRKQQHVLRQLGGRSVACCCSLEVQNGMRIQ